MTVEEFIEPMPCSEPEIGARLVANLLWDRLYPDLVDFAVALVQGQPKAVARLVEVCGLYAAERVQGESVWTEFPSYKRFVRPVRRRQLEILHAWHENLTAA